MNEYDSKRVDGLEVACWPLVPQIRRFTPGRSRRIFKREKILSTLSFGGKVQPSVPCRRFAACKRYLEFLAHEEFQLPLLEVSGVVGR
jgi:hypothetical protein